MASMPRNFFDAGLLNDIQKNELLQKVNSKSHPEGDCVIWDASVNSAGYPQVKLGKNFKNLFSDKPFSPAGVVYAIHNNVSLNRANYQISHLCHVKKVRFLGSFDL